MAGNNAASDGRSSCGWPWWQGDGQAVWHPFCHRQVRADPHRRGTGSCHIPSQQDGVDNVHRASQPAPAVNFTFHVEHCCHALFYFFANLNIAMSAVPDASWMSGLRQMLMPVWADEVFRTVGPLGTGSEKARTWGGIDLLPWGDRRGSALAGQWFPRTKLLCLSEKLFLKCYCKDSGDENNDKKDDTIFTKFHFF